MVKPSYHKRMCKFMSKQSQCPDREIYYQIDNYRGYDNGHVYIGKCRRKPADKHLGEVTGKKATRYYAQYQTAQ